MIPNYFNPRHIGYKRVDRIIRPTPLVPFIAMHSPHEFIIDAYFTSPKLIEIASADHYNTAWKLVAQKFDN